MWFESWKSHPSSEGWCPVWLYGEPTPRVITEVWFLHLKLPLAVRIGSPHLRSKYTRVILHIPFLRYVCVCVSCLIENSILVVLSINPLFLFKPSTTFHQSCHLFVVGLPKLETFEVTAKSAATTKRISSDTVTPPCVRLPDDECKSDLPRRNPGQWKIAWRLFVRGGGGRLLPGRRDRPIIVPTFKQCLCCFFPGDAFKHLV